MEPPLVKMDQHFSKTRIAFVANVGYSLFHEEIQETYGGGQIELYLLAKELQKKDNYDVAMIFLDYGQPHEERVDGIRLLKSYPPRNRGWLVLQFLGACYRLWNALHRANADIYFHEGAEFEIAVTRLFCLVKRRTYVFRCANIIDVDGRYHKANPLHGRLFSFGLSGANALIAQTKDQERLLKRRRKNVRVIENMFPHDSQRASPNGSMVLWIGRLTKVKRPELFLRLAEKFPNDRFLMVGSVDTIDIDYARRIQTQAKDIKNLRYIEKTPFRETPAIFNQARVLVNTSVYEGFPVTFVQAMCDGVPILTLGLDPDSIVSSVAGFVATDMQDLGTKYSLLRKQPIWQKYSFASLQYAKEHYSPEVIVPKYEALFKTVLAK